MSMARLKNLGSNTEETRDKIKEWAEYSLDNVFITWYSKKWDFDGYINAIGEITCNSSKQKDIEERVIISVTSDNNLMVGLSKNSVEIYDALDDYHKYFK